MHGDIEQLRTEIDELRAELAAMRSASAASASANAASAEEAEPAEPEPAGSRRDLLRLAGAAAVGGAAAMLPSARAAADNGWTNNTSLMSTLTHVNALNTGFHFRCDDSPYGTNKEVVQISTGATNRHCLRAFANNGTSAIFVRNQGIGAAMLAGSSSIGSTIIIDNSVGPLLLLSRTSLKVDPRLRTGESHLGGELDVDGAGNLWYCHTQGASPEPGQWRKLSGPTAAGAYHAVAPFRAYDSRLPAYSVNGTLGRAAVRRVAVTDAHDVDTGAVTATGLVPAGATAITFNVTITGTTGANFLTVAPGGATTVTASTINWSGPGVTIANASVTPVDDDRHVALLTGDNPATTHVIVDVTGYFL